MRHLLVHFPLWMTGTADDKPLSSGDVYETAGAWVRVDVVGTLTNEHVNAHCAFQMSVSIAHGTTAVVDLRPLGLLMESSLLATTA